MDKIVSCPSSGKLAFGLTAKGKEEVMNALSRHPWLGSDIKIFCSAFLRARESAEIAAGIFGATVVIEERLNERFFGAWEGSSCRNYERVWAADPANGSADGVERPSAVMDRMLSLIRALERSSAGKRFLLVSHGDPIQILMAHCQGLNPGDHRSLDPVPTAGLRYLPNVD